MLRIHSLWEAQWEQHVHISTVTLTQGHGIVSTVIPRFGWLFFSLLPHSLSVFKQSPWNWFHIKWTWIGNMGQPLLSYTGILGCHHFLMPPYFKHKNTFYFISTFITLVYLNKKPFRGFYMTLLSKGKNWIDPRRPSRWHHLYYDISMCTVSRKYPKHWGQESRFLNKVTYSRITLSSFLPAVRIAPSISFYSDDTIKKKDSSWNSVLNLEILGIT